MLLRNTLPRHMACFKELDVASSWRKPGDTGFLGKHTFIWHPQAPPPFTQTCPKPPGSTTVPCLGTPRAPAAWQAPASPPASSCCLPQPQQRLRGFLSCCKQPEPPALLGAFGGTEEQEEPAPPRERSGRLSPGFRSPLSTPTPPRSFPRAICQVPARWNFTLLF